MEISEYLDFSFYDWCWYNDNAGLGETKLGWWLGVSHRVGSLMSYWVLTLQGNVISRTTVWRVTNLEQQVSDNKTRLTDFDNAIKDRLNDDAYIIVGGGGGVGWGGGGGGGGAQPFDWSDHPFDDDPDFIDKFQTVISN